MENPSKETLDKWHKDPNNWKLGGIYYNKDDKRILLPKRIKWMGWTVNFANTKSVLFFIIILVVMFTLLYFSNVTN